MKQYYLLTSLLFSVSLILTNQNPFTIDQNFEKQEPLTNDFIDQEDISQLRKAEAFLAEQTEDEAKEFHRGQDARTNQNWSQRKNQLEQKYVDELIQTSPAEIKELIKNYHLVKDNEVKEIREAGIPSALLLVGDPGVGKSDLAKAIAQSLGAPCVFVQSGSLGNEYQNSVVANLKRIIDEIETSNDSLTVVVLDEIQALTDQNNINKNQDAGFALGQMITEATNKKNILFIATANYSKDLPEQIKSRFYNAIVTIQKPDQAKKERILSYHLNYHLENKIIDSAFIKKTANLSSDFTARDLKALSSSIILDLISQNNNINDKSIKSQIEKIKNGRSKMTPSYNQEFEKFCKDNEYKIRTISMAAGAIASLAVAGSKIYKIMHTAETATNAASAIVAAVPAVSAITTSSTTIAGATAAPAGIFASAVTAKATIGGIFAAKAAPVAATSLGVFTSGSTGAGAATGIAVLSTPVIVGAGVALVAVGGGYAVYLYLKPHNQKNNEYSEQQNSTAKKN